MARVRIADLEQEEFRRNLHSSGICIETGPFLVRIQSNVSDLSQHIYKLYADFHMDMEMEFSDFHIRIVPHGRVRRWLFPQIRFIIDDSAPFNTMPARLALPLFEWGLNWAIARQANQYLIVHSAVLEKGGCALMLPSPPGSGKSTLCAALVINGWRLLSDELALIRPENGHVVPMPRPISLKNESIALIGGRSSNANLGPLFTDTQKGTIAHMLPSRDSIARAHESVPVGWFVFPSYRSGEPTVFRRLSRGQSLMRAADNSFNYSLLGKKGFETLAAVTDDADSYELTYGNLDEAIARLGDELLKPQGPGAGR